MKQENLHQVTLILLTLLVAACSATGPRVQQVSTVHVAKATVHLYRPGKFIGGGITPLVHLNCTEFFGLPNAGNARMESGPGEHVTETGKSRNILVADVVGKATPIACGNFSEALSFSLVRH
ncbi:MAG: hypothetical protein AB7O21_16430 [Gammaproteobacteria bacterium]